MLPKLTAIAGYCVRSCPRYHSEEESFRAIENFLVQSTLWGAVRFLLVGQRGVSVELRFVSNATDRSTAIYLFLYRREGEHSDEAINSLERLLPLDYGWSRVAATELYRLVHAPMPASEWFLAKLVRRMEFLDLPASYPWLFGNQPGQPVSAKEPQFHGEINVFGKRKIPTALSPVWIQHKTEPLCLPLLGDMVDQSPDRHRLCLELQFSAPVVLSVSVHPVEPESLDEDRRNATHLRRCLEPFAGAVASAGFARLKELHAVYDRYWLPSSYLCNVLVRVAAPDPAKAVGVAHSMSAQLGGMRAFDIFTSAGSRPTLDNLANPDVDLPTRAMFAAEGSAWSDRLNKRMAKLNVEFEDGFSGFLIRMPHLYTLDEAERVLRLPYASDKGLPGVRTVLVPPFYSPGSQYVPFDSKPAPDLLRIGVARTSAVVVDEGSTSDVGFSLAESKSGQWHCIKRKDLTKHALIVGSTGSGKSVTTQFLLRELHMLKVPFLIVEPVKTEYASRLKENGVAVKRVNLEGTPQGKPSPDFLRFDPMRLQDGVSVGRHISYLKSCFQAAWPLDDFFSLMLENGIREYYMTPIESGGCGLSLFDEGSGAKHKFLKRRRGSEIVATSVYPSFETFSQFFLEKFLPKDLGLAQSKDKAGTGNPRFLERLEEWRQIFARRFKNLQEGPLGWACRLADEDAVKAREIDHFGKLLESNTVVELDAIPDNDDKALAMAFLMTFLFERRQSEDLRRRRKGEPEPKDLGHVLVVEEAHRLLSNQAAAGRARGESAGADSKQKAVSLFVDMLAEIRAYGQGIVIVEQIPTKIVPEAVKNTNLKVMLRLTSKDDREFLGDAMNFNEAQKNFVNNLKTGQFVVFEEGVDQPVLLSLPAEKSWPDILW